MSSPPLGLITIGAREIYDAATRLAEQVTRLVGQHDGTRQDTLADHEARLRVLERGRWPLPALAALVSVIAVVIAAADLLH